MRVAFITQYSELYGANRSLLNLISGLKEYGIQAMVVTRMEGDLTEQLTLLNIPYTICPFSLVVSKVEFNKANSGWAGIKKKLWRFRNNLKAAWILRKILKQWKADIIYTNSSVISVGYIISKLMNLPHVWHIRELADLYYGLKFDYGKAVLRFALKSSDATVCISNVVKSHIFKGNPGKNVHVIYNGIASSLLFDTCKQGFKPFVRKDNFAFLIIGKLGENKGQEEAIKALEQVLKKYNKVRLLIAGSGDRISVDKLISDLKIKSNVEFLDFVKDPFEAFRISDAMLMCSRFEAMGRVTVEAMAAMKPVIGFDSFGTAELIQHEKNGLLYKNGVKDLASCMIRLIENPELCNSLVNYAWVEARKKYSIENYSHQVYGVLQSLNR